MWEVFEGGVLSDYFSGQTGRYEPGWIDEQIKRNKKSREISRAGTYFSRKNFSFTKNRSILFTFYRSNLKASFHNISSVADRARNLICPNIINRKLRATGGCAA